MEDQFNLLENFCWMPGYVGFHAMVMITTKQKNVATQWWNVRTDDEEEKILMCLFMNKKQKNLQLFWSV